MARRPISGAPVTERRPAALHWALVVLRSVLVLALAAGCGSNKGESSPTGPAGGGATTGSLSVAITAPSGVTGSATVLGPGSYAKTITAQQTLTGLAPGSYTVIAGAGSGSGPIVGIPYDGAVTGSPATVTAGATTRATVTYTQRTSEGLLLVATGGNSVTGFTSTQLSSSGAPAATITLNARATNVVVDATGGIWVCYGGSDTLAYYTKAQVLAGGSQTPTVKIRATHGQTSDIAGIALDARGDLWAADRVSNNLYEYAPSQLTSSGTPAPAVMIQSALGSLNGPWALAFDPSGDLWVVDTNDSTIVEFNPAQLIKGGTLEPAGGIQPTGGFGISIAFDSAGDLWTGGLDGVVTEYTPAQISTVGAPTPTVTLNIGAHALPAALAFDASGDLWVAEEAGGKLYMYTPGQLKAGGSVTPTTTLTKNGLSLGPPTGLAFAPHSPALPLH